MNTRTFIRQQSQLIVWFILCVIMFIGFIAAGIHLKVFSLPSIDPMTKFTEIECRMGGVTVAEGYADRDGVYRQTIYTDNGLKRTITLVPGMYCDRSLVTLRRSELPQYLREKR
jgi:hypothetical protein